MWVLTVDQVASRQVGDRVEHLLAALQEVGPLAGDAGGRGTVRPFERTAGDEVQAVMSDPRLVTDVALHLAHLREWSIGIGCGQVDEPLPEHARAGSGPAFFAARDAVNAVKAGRRRSRSRIAVRGPNPDLASEAESIFALLGALDDRRTTEGHAVIDRMLDMGGAIRQEDLASELGITQQAVSARLRAAMWSEELAARPAAARLLSLADQGERTDR